MGDRGLAHKVGTLSNRMDDLHSGEILQIIHKREYPVAWSASLYSIESRSQVYGSFLGEFLESHENTVDDEHRFSSPDGRSVKEDHRNFRGHATGMRFGS